MNKRPLLITSNGFGMGHLVRQIAISRHFENPTIMTLSGAAPVVLASNVLSAGARLEYCPSYTMPWISKRAWHRGYLRDRIVALAGEVEADVLVFDGVVPYFGLASAIKELQLPAVWVRRGLWRKSAKTWPLKYSSLFDVIIEPSDIGTSHDEGATKYRRDAKKVGVITEAGSMLPRADAAAALKVDPSKPTLLLNIGSAPGFDLGDLEIPAGWNVVATKDALDRQRSSHSITSVSGIFPLHPYLSTVDLAVTSVGYNAAHEFVACGVPTVVTPSDNATDDQYARADAMVAAGVSLRANSGAEINQCLKALTDETVRSEFATRAKGIAHRWSNGASEAADLIAHVCHSSRRRPLRMQGRKLVESLLGLRGKRIGPEVVESEVLTSEMVAGRALVEHLIPESSQRYRARRGQIAAEWSVRK